MSKKLLIFLWLLVGTVTHATPLYHYQITALTPSVKLPIEPQMDCDILTKKNGEEIQVSIQEIGVSEVKYKKCDNLSGPTYTIAKNEVFSIKYKNGNKEVFTNTDSPNTSNILTAGDKKIEGYSLASLIIGGAGLFGWVFPIFGLAMAIAGIILGVIGLKKVRKNPNSYVWGKNMATWGIIFSCIWGVIYLIWTIYYIYVLAVVLSA